MTIELKPCPFCGGAVQPRDALWPSEGDTDAVIHAEPTDCPMVSFSNYTADKSVYERWNARAAIAALGHNEALKSSPPEKVTAPTPPASTKDFTREAFHNYVENKRPTPPVSDLTTQIRKLAETFAYPLLSGREGQWTAEELEPVLSEFVTAVRAEAKAEQHAADVSIRKSP
jgi:hypothetical protein